MRLLEKREVDQRRAEQERARNLEGAKLAKKVEHVRELAAETKGAYERYRENALKSIQSELAPLYEQRDKLVSDIREKRAEWDKLLKPLDKQFALYVKTERGNIEAEQARQALEATRINRISQEQVEKDKEQSLAAKLNEKGRLEAGAMKKDAEELHKTAEASLSSAKREAVSLIESAGKQALASQRQAQTTALQVQQVQNRSNALDMREKELEDREMAVIIKELQQYSPVQRL